MSKRKTKIETCRWSELLYSWYGYCRWGVYNKCPSVHRTAIETTTDHCAKCKPPFYQPMEARDAAL